MSATVRREREKEMKIPASFSGDGRNDVDDASLALVGTKSKEYGVLPRKRNLALRWVDREKGFHDCFRSHLPNGTTRESKTSSSEDEFGHEYSAIYRKLNGKPCSDS